MRQFDPILSLQVSRARWEKVTSHCAYRSLSVGVNHYWQRLFDYYG